MSIYRLETLTRDQYIHSIAMLEDAKSMGFAEMSLNWWDRHFSWKPGGCVVLTDEEDCHLCYLFYKIDRYRDYMTLHNLLTPLKYRRNGYAKVLLEQVFEAANEQHVKRFRATCVPQSLDFYLSLGFVYWGITEARNYYCDLPMPTAGLDDLDAMVHRTSTITLIGASRYTICNKIRDNEKDLDQTQQLRYDSDLEKMKTAYMIEHFSCVEPQ